jgi:hypothetical protein
VRLDALEIVLSEYNKPRAVAHPASIGACTSQNRKLSRAGSASHPKLLTPRGDSLPLSDRSESALRHFPILATTFTIRARFSESVTRDRQLLWHVRRTQ